MFFSYAVRSVYIESCSLFVRGGVYRVVKEALGGFLAKLVRLGPDVRLHPHRPDQRRLGRPVHHRPGASTSLADLSDPTLTVDDRRPRKPDQELGLGRHRRRRHALLLPPEPAGIHESSDKALKIMIVTTVMGVIMLGWCGADPRASRAADQRRPLARAAPDAAHQLQQPSRRRRDASRDPLGFIEDTELAERAARRARSLDADGNRSSRPTATRLRRPDFSWLSLIGLLGLVHRLRPLDPGHERRGDAGPGLPRGRVAQAAELQEGGLHRLRLQPGPDRRHQLPGRAAHPRRRAHEQYYATTSSAAWP